MENLLRKYHTVKLGSMREYVGVSGLLKYLGVGVAEDKVVRVNWDQICKDLCAVVVGNRKSLILRLRC